MKSESYWQVNAHSQVKSMRDDNPAVVEIGPSLFSRPKVYSCARVWCYVSVCSVNCWYRRLVSGPVKRQFMDGMYFLTESMGATKVSCCRKILDSQLRSLLTSEDSFLLHSLRHIKALLVITQGTRLNLLMVYQTSLPWRISSWHPATGQGEGRLVPPINPPLWVSRLRHSRYHTSCQLHSSILSVS